jgi:protein-tyrosine phosphatase
VLIAGVSPSITKVLDGLFLGGRRDAEALSSANPHQIATVITLCEEPVGRRALGIRYLHFPVRDARPISIAWLNAILTSIEDGMARGRVLVHCGAGVSRAPTVVAAMLDRMGFLGFTRAMSYLEDLRPVVAPSKALVEGIERELSQST